MFVRRIHAGGVASGCGEHELRCGQGLSVRQVQAALAGEHGVCRSIGIVQRDLRLGSCEHCQDGGDG